MAKSSYERALDKQRREAKRIAEQEARRAQARAIVDGQPIVGGMRILDKASEEILKILLSLYDGNDNRRISGEHEIFPGSYYHSIGLEFEKLIMYGVVTSYQPYINEWYAVLAPQGITYFEDKEIAQEKESKTNHGSINIGSIIANGSNLILGDVINSSLSVDNSIQRIEQEIEEKGGEDADALKELLGEVKELIENIKDSRHIPKSKSLFSKLSTHLEKHGWFYGEVIGLLGATALQLLQG